MANLGDTPFTLNHAGFTQHGEPRISLPRPLGIAWAFYELSITAASPDPANFVLLRPQGVGAYVYTLADVWLQMEFQSSDTSPSGLDEARAFAESFGAVYTHYPLFNDISNQKLAGIGPGQSIQRQWWGFDAVVDGNIFATTAQEGSQPHGFRVVLSPARNPNHAGNFPTAIPEVWSEPKSPQVNIDFGEVTTPLVSQTVKVRAGVAYRFWDPNDRLSADANAELPVRGT